jgi:diguanylate cyclase (GGDEF)-like protein
VALLRHAEGGARSGFAPLLLLPVVWLALYSGRAPLSAAIVLMGATITGPVLFIGGFDYPASEWRKAFIYLMVGSMVGFVIQRLVEKARTRTEDLELRGRTMSIVASAMRELPTESDVRGRICETVLGIGDANYCVLMEPDGENRLVSSGQAGLDLDRIVLPLSDERSQIVGAFSSGKSCFVADAPWNSRSSRQLLEPTGAASMLYEPVLRGDQCVAVICVAWRRRVRSLRSAAVEGVGLLAAEAGVAMERADLVDRVTKLARTDPLTGLANRRTWDEALALEQDRARRSAIPMCVALLDLDHFKSYNDSKGHQAGDLLLKEVSAAWRTQLRDIDTIARWGGEEFALMLPACSLDQAETVLKRLQSATPKVITFSAGVARWDERESALHLMQRADAALYSAKQTGRNRVTVGAASSDQVSLE